MSADEQRIEELRQIVAAVKERVRSRYPRADAVGGGEGPAVTLTQADLMPILHARDAAQAKVAAIGRVNPRAGGPVNATIQAVKKVVARSLGWFVREQVAFNREMVAAVEAIVEALNDHNRALGGQDIQRYWSEWRHGQEQRLTAMEIQLLRSMAELQGAFQHRVTQMESNFREIAAAQHANFQGALERATVDIQKRLWADLETIRWRHERMIHTELRLVRQRLGRQGAQTEQGLPDTATGGAAIPTLDYARFAERFRGPEETVRKAQEFYRPRFEGRDYVLDIGCGRGEFLEMMREMGVRAKGIDLSAESVAVCREKGLDAEVADLFAFLGASGEDEFDGIFCSQVVEHLDPMRLPAMISLCAEKLARGGVIAIETPNPECLAIFATFFYLDPTHTRPAPRQLLEFYMEEAGLSEIETHLLSPAREMFLEIAELPEGIRSRFFSGLDYAILARKL